MNDFLEKEKSAFLAVIGRRRVEKTYLIDEVYAKKLRNRKHEFIEHTKTKKTVFNTLITNYGSKKNEHFLDVIDTEFTVSDLMK